MKYPFAVIGIVIALAGIAVAVFQNHLRIQEPVPVAEKKSLKSRIFATGLKLAGLKKVEKNKPQSRFRIDGITFTYMLLGFMALVLGVVSYVKKENKRLSAVAAALGLVAIAWEYVLIAVGVAFFLLIIGNL